jgi:hypothetical protein
MYPSEIRFKIQAVARGYRVKSSEVFDNRDRKWDFELNGVTKVDVKQAKRIKRYQRDVQYSHLWVEHTNVRGGIGSSLGDADWFAYEVAPNVGQLRSTWLIVPARIVSLLPIDWNNTSTIPDLAEDVVSYQSYERTQSLRHDKIALVPIEDLSKIALDRWEPIW